MKTAIKRKIAYDAWSQGLIDKMQLDLMYEHCAEIDRLELKTDAMADKFYAMMVNKQATINLKDYGND